MKRIAFVLLVIIVASMIAALIFIKPSLPVQNVSETSNPKTPIQVSPINANAGMLYLGDFKNASTGVTISFKPSPLEGRNVVDGVYVNQEKIGEISGLGVFVVGYSPNNNYFVLKTMSVLGESRVYDVYVIDVKESKVLDLKPRVDSPSYPGGPTFPSGQPNPDALDLYIDWVAWSGNHSIDIRSYRLWNDYNEASSTITYYRLSPEETWRHDLSTGSSTLVQVAP